MTRSMSAPRTMSAVFPRSAEDTPTASATTALNAAVTSPSRILMDSPASVRTNISRPIKSVPNRCPADGS